MKSEDSTSRKRKTASSAVRTGVEPAADAQASSPRKKRKGMKAAKGKAGESLQCPEYFDEVCGKQ